MQSPIPILLDTDLGSDVDDALALALLLAAPEALDLKAVTTVAADTAGRAKAAAKLLGIGGRTDIEVCAGAEQALVRRDAFVWRDIELMGYPAAPEAILSDEPAAERIVRAAKETPGLHLLAIGPLTNLGHAVGIDPELPKRVSGLTLMGGHIRRVAIGDKVCPPGIDYNLCSDPEAAMTVLGAGFETRLVTADVTLETWITTADLETWRQKGGPVAQALVPLVDIWTPYMTKIFVEGLGGTLAPDNVAYLHDPLTIQALIDPSCLTFERLHILPTIAAGVFRTHEVPADSGYGIPMEVATAVDADLARRTIVDRITTV